MLTSTLAKLYQRDLAKLKDEIAAYPNDADLWDTADGTANSAGNLCQHLTGNLKHFIGAVVGERVMFATAMRNLRRKVRRVMNCSPILTGRRMS